MEGGVFGALGPKMLARQQGGLDCTRNARQEKVSEFLKWREFGLPIEISKKHRFFSAKNKLVWVYIGSTALTCEVTWPTWKCGT